MPLSAGTRLGPYEVLGLIGAGGMGEVYKARDTRLDRTVAIKLLPSHLTDPEHRARFEREAKTIAGLSHPHICSLYDVGEHALSLFLVMEHLEGSTLTERLRKGALPISQALEIGVQTAEALSAAHRAGVVHRDLKPANVMLTKSGVKLLDFGLAKLNAVAAQPAFASGVSQSTRSEPLTGRGMILGTLQYMAPEQLEGKETDARTDIWALGLLLYEMLTGKRAFEGQSSASLIAAILERPPTPITAVNRIAPPALNRLVLQCLAKNAADRWDSAHDIADELRWISQTDTTVATRTSRRSWQRTAAVVSLAVLGAASGAIMTWNLRPSSGPIHLSRLLIDISASGGLNVTGPQTGNDGRPFGTAVAIAPDGRSLAFSGVQGDRRQLYIRRLERLEAEPLAGTEGAENPFFSADGRWVGYWARGELRKISGDGGPPVTICALARPFGQTWDARDWIVIGQVAGGLWQVPASGGSPEPLTVLDVARGEVSHRLPHMMPNGDVLFTITYNRFPRWTETRLAVFSRQSRSHRVVLEGGADGQYINTGHLVYVRSGALMAVPFDLRRTDVTGAAVGLVSGVLQSAYGSSSAADTGAGQFSVSAEGTLVYVPGSVVPDGPHAVYWVDRTGRAETLALPPRPFSQPRIAPDGERVALHTQQAEQDIWIYSLVRRTLTRLTVEGRNATPVWSPDGRRIVYRSSVTGPDDLFWLPIDRNGRPQRLTTTSEHEVPAAWSPDGRVLAFYRLSPAGGPPSVIWTLSLDGNREARQLMGASGAQGGADFSPDGKWLAYATAETGRLEVYVAAFPAGGGRQQVSVDGGMSPVWSHDGRELFFVSVPSGPAGSSSLRIMSTTVSIGPVVQFGAPRVLFEGPYESNFPGRTYDVAPDGQHFVLVQRTEMPPVPLKQFVLVQNWFEELKAKVPAAR